MVTYLSPFIPSLSTHTAPLQELLKKDSEFMWNPTCQEAFNQIKKLVCKDTTLWYFDMFGNPSLSKLMHQRRDLELHSCKKDAQSPLLPKLLPLQSNDMPT